MNYVYGYETFMNELLNRFGFSESKFKKILSVPRMS